MVRAIKLPFSKQKKSHSTKCWTHMHTPTQMLCGPQWRFSSLATKLAHPVEKKASSVITERRLKGKELKYKVPRGA